MKWVEICIHTSQQAVDPVSNILYEAGSSGVVIEDPEVLTREWTDQYGEIYDLSPSDYPETGVYVKGYLPETVFLPDTVEQIREAVDHLVEYEIDVQPNQIYVGEVKEEDWATAWKKYYKPVRVTDSLVISPTWEEVDKSNPNEVLIELDPGMAFGTGTHPTTVLCLRALEGIVKTGDTVLDVGTGSGVLSIAAAKWGASRVLALDLDDVAVRSARENVELNQVESRVEVRQNNLVQSIQGQYDVIVANILAEIVLKLIDDATQLMKPNGFLVLSGIIKKKQEVVEQALLKAGLTINEVLVEEDWVAIIAQK
ncbi:50S ribosomal protein L11 methyltransferase [Pullulanibacillus sp. KACC 23026]|uniref:50S ribosomal protein L11 methyltransferase n=1 Tax=Pullulanibacillus sp. KACC 23026 TaxID=3028315 RepID=UPI0023AFCEF1|nr:50S ribosomal protein L11 methyltransferase [Pullulanibacillus sp. KACC 23026]WEG14223.1 50S ribosomal protein L11 methyltransferase [Pullulanibacillus sp. KACC 23026]